MRPDEIGALRRRLELQRPVRTTDEGGTAVIAWETVTALWAEVRTLSGAETLGADRTEAGLRLEVRLRHRGDVTAGMRFRLFEEGRERLLGITAVLDGGSWRQWLLCRCEEEAP